MATSSITAIQTRNKELCRARLYSGQASEYDPDTSNVRYEFLASDSSQLYRKYSKMHGIDVAQEAQYNIDNWLNPNSHGYKPEVASAVFHYTARTTKEDHLSICIQTTPMKVAAWKYTHHGQLILDGTFGVCDSRLLLFIVLRVDEAGKGVPLAFFLFSAPTGSRATHAGYDTTILIELRVSWKESLGSHNGQIFTPRVAITDTDTKECGALTMVWPEIWLILCKFHVRHVKVW